MADATPHVPCFALLAVSNTLAYSTFGASIPLLPLLLPEGSNVIFSSTVLLAFIVPALFVNPVISSKSRRPATLPITLICGAFFEALGPLLLTSQLLFTTVEVNESRDLHSLWSHAHVILRPSAARALITASMFMSGFGAALSQYGLVRFVGVRMSSLPMDRRRQCVGVHLAVLEACIAAGTIISPVVFAFFATTRQNVFTPFLASGIMQLSLALYIAFVLPSETAITYQLISGENNVEQTLSQEEIGTMRAPESMTSSYGSIAVNYGDSTKSLPSRPQVHEQGEEDEGDPGVLHALKHPWVWMVLFSMLVSASSASFLRPVLTPRITDELKGSRMFAASLFSLCALIGVVSESLAITLLSARLGVRNTVILGLLVCLAGFQILGEKSLTSLAVILIVAGSSSSLVLTVTDLSQTTHVNVAGISNSLSLLAGFTFSVGEIFGTVTAGLLYDAHASFEEAVSSWHRFLAVSCAIILTPYLVGLVIQCLSPWMFLVIARRRRARATVDTWRRGPLLSSEQNGQ